MARPKTADKIDEIIEEIPVETVNIKEEAPKNSEMPKKIGIKDIVGLTEEQKNVLIEDGLSKILHKMPGSGYTFVTYGASEGYPRTVMGVLMASKVILEEYIEFYTVNVGPISGEKVIDNICTKFGRGMFVVYPGIASIQLN